MQTNELHYFFYNLLLQRTEKLNSKCNSLKKFHTKPKLLFKADPNEDQAQHVGKQMNDTSMQPDTTDKSPPLMAMDNFVPFQSSQFFQSVQADRIMYCKKLKGERQLQFKAILFKLRY